MVPFSSILPPSTVSIVALKSGIKKEEQTLQATKQFMPEMSGQVLAQGRSVAQLSTTGAAQSAGSWWSNDAEGSELDVADGSAGVATSSEYGR